ncbi:PucR family transcriptional regulator [Bifidobacterium primatium]|uniref:PucR family transcriptional regulator n=2 Tax=Bifidobacterium primatium TaxID=2045438 RepID=A0A2M9HBQ6_9BIFI|nr:PucR family transcriptional regulator [Bifidobacterium primatium]
MTAMTVRLKELFEQAKDHEVTLLAGQNGLERPVRWVHMVENEEIAGFLEGQEIAFTTGIGLESQEDLISVVRKCDENGASGLVVNVGPFIRQISPEVIRYCNAHDFPLFRVPWSVHMAQIMHQFSLTITMSEKHSMELAAALENAIFWPDREELYMDYMDQNGFGQQWNYCVGVMEVCACDDRQGTPARVNDTRLAAFVRAAESLITRHQWRAALLQLEHRMVMVFARYDIDKVEAMVRSVLAACRRITNDDELLYLGIGKVTRTARCIGKSYAQGLKLERLQKHRGRDGEPFLYEDSGVDKLLLSIPDTEILEDYYESTIGPLVEHDRVNNTDLTETLRTYLRFSGSVKETAETMIVHRNTVTYKINKIEHILGMNLSDFAAREQLSLGLRVREILDC